ncbi:MAG: metallophosphoesterase [Blautia sp.]|nr:metallophosphoesterase [Blautia sp.]
MKEFKVVTYEIYSKKLKGEDVCFAFLSDFHGICYSDGTKALVNAIHEAHPDAVLIGGDMYVGDHPDTMQEGFSLVKKLSQQYPVFYTYGNHEYKLHLRPEDNTAEQYEKDLKECGVQFLHNSEAVFDIKGTVFQCCGLELPSCHYRKAFAKPAKVEDLQKLLPKPRTDAFQILLAHNPRYGDTYLKYGADLILSGHYHGGVIRLNEKTGIVSPMYEILPRYCCGMFSRQNRHMIVSAGIGEHSVKLRIHNPRDFVVVRIKSGQKHALQMKE